MPPLLASYSAESVLRCYPQDTNCCLEVAESSLPGLIVMLNAKLLNQASVPALAYQLCLCL